MDWMLVLGPSIAAAVFVVIMMAVPEPARREFGAVFSAGFATLYVNGGFGLWEFAYMAVAVVPSYLGLRHYRWIGVAWLMHSGWDWMHHLYGNPLWHWSETSSFGCMIMDALVAVWYFAGAPSLFHREGTGELVTSRNTRPPLSRG